VSAAAVVAAFTATAGLTAATAFATAVVTNAVVAISVLLSVAACVGAVGLPVKAGLAENTTLPVPVVPATSLPWMASIIGTFRAGGSYLPVDADWPEVRLARVLGRSDCRAVAS